LSFIVRVAGPEFSNKQNRDAFARIEESIRQFSAHSRESFAVVRSPLDLRDDHFILLWSRGSALVVLLPFGGRIRGGRHGRWITEERLEHSVSEITIENPHDLLEAQRSTIEALLKVGGPVPAENGEGELRLEDRYSPFVKLVAIFTGDVQDIRIEDDNDASFAAISMEYAMSRTMFHMPNLLRLSDRGSLVFTGSEIEVLSASLERDATVHHVSASPEKNGQLLRYKRNQRKRNRPKLFLIVATAAIVLAAVFLLLRRPGSSPAQKDKDSSQVIRPHVAVSAIVIKLPVETQLVVSSQVYQSRTELDNALSHGAVWRYLPDTVQYVHLDSLTFAKGVYGYFKVDNAWRKGKLLQTFKARDTIVVDNFLEPLK
jgi:hypothetical protein